MRFDFCIPTRGAKVPHTPDWLHEIKYDGYRLSVERDGDRVRLITRGGRLDQAISLDRRSRAKEPPERSDTTSSRAPDRHPAGRRHLHHKASESRARGRRMQAAMEALILVAESGGPTMFARIGVKRALNRHVERVFNPDRKEHHSGRKLARDR